MKKRSRMLILLIVSVCLAVALCSIAFAAPISRTSLDIPTIFLPNSTEVYISTTDGRELVICDTVAFSYDNEFKELIASHANHPTANAPIELSSNLEETTLYMTAPVAYAAAEIEKYCVDLNGNAETERSSANWFSITDVIVRENAANEGNYEIVVNFIPLNDELLPRYPYLISGNQSVAGHLGLNFDEAKRVVSGEFIFPLSTTSEAESIDYMENATLQIDAALEFIPANELTVSSNNKTLTFVIVD